MAYSFNAEIAQLVEQWTENPCVPSSTLGLGILFSTKLRKNAENAFFPEESIKAESIAAFFQNLLA